MGYIFSHIIQSAQNFFSLLQTGSYSDQCTALLPILNPCFNALQSGDSFMRAESICCKSFIALDQIVGDSAVRKYEICGCLKGFEGEKQRLFNEKLLEVQVLCGPNVPFPITPFSDCIMPMWGTL
ncbi:hypothetical protein SUGI_0194490 [Cryptomeria japonica]|nr:hypothetical protein SUGI_0194490 [Cryptomeria japonica]